MRRLTTGLLVALTLAVWGPAFTRLDAVAAAGTLAIYNFGQVDSGYLRGAQPNQAGVAALAATGVRTVIDLQAEGNPNEPRLVEAAGMKYVRIPMTTRVAPTAAQITEFLSLVSDPANLPVYVHCKEGRHRTGVMTAVYRMTRDGWNADRAFAEMKQYKFGLSFLHPEFKRFVFAFKAAPSKAADLPDIAGGATATR